jgi:ABC-2 type transport system permease protein
MRNAFLIARREYLERVRTKAFLIFTLVMPAIMACLTILPARLMMKTGKPKNLLVVASTADFASNIKNQILSRNQEAGLNLVITTAAAAEVTQSDAEQRLTSKKLDSLLWTTDEALASQGAVYTARDTSDFIERDVINSALQRATNRQRLIQRGIPPTDVEALFEPVKFVAKSLDKAGIKDLGQIIAISITLMILLYVTVLTYGMFVMRSVIEEKTSRVMEVLLSTATSQQLMAGKILGVGAVGLTQIGIWFLVGSALAGSAAMAITRFVNLKVITLPQLIFFVVFFLLGYFLYSSICAALGAMCNSDQEAQQLTLLVVLPLVSCMMFMWMVVRNPNAPLSVALSMIPFTAPLLMFLRIMVQQPPLWQIAISIGILVGTIYGLVWVCSRIYRVGILMYGKRPTLPEIVKWVKYA